MNHINRLLAVLSIALSVGAMEQPAGVNSSDQIQVINRTNKEIEIFFERTGKKSLVFKPGETKQLANFDPKRHTILFQGEKVLPSANARYVDEKTGKIKYHIYDHYVLKMFLLFVPLGAQECERQCNQGASHYERFEYYSYE